MLNILYKTFTINNIFSLYNHFFYYNYIFIIKVMLLILQFITLFINFLI